jgi:predicted DNA-binding transcriptional regulator AlpA
MVGEENVVQEVTLDEEQGVAEQLDLPLVDAEIKDEANYLRLELQLIDAPVVAGAIGVAEQTLAAWRSDKTGPDYVKLGKNVFYRADDLRRWIGTNVVSVAKAA